MNKKYIAVGILSALGLFASVANAADGDPETTPTTPEGKTALIVNGGSVHFTGEVTNGACAVNANSTNLTVPLGQVKAEDLKEAKSFSGSQGFTLQLDNCAAEIYKTAAISFSGITLEDNKDVLALQGSASGTAKNIGIQILDNNGKAMAVDGSQWSNAQELTQGTHQFAFQARYYSLGNPVAGSANADASFRIQYL